MLDRDLRFHALTDEEARKDMTGRIPQEYIDAFFSFYAEGTIDESRIYPTVQQVTGSPPRSFRHWALAHRDGFAAP